MSDRVNLLNISFEEKETIRNIIINLLRNRSKTISELIEQLFSEPYSFDRGFGTLIALRTIIGILEDLQNDGLEPMDWK